ncbi:hypothetical protein N802_17915 [Knoellia sinensis KCTC 19936]|uniref:Uncharacterized protein n=1 Tax=Knoellia sinensis KCTC 19936 TaxID=1385520 RepID=A0A0A0J4E2_9MICO|nr:hypothetical protein N802_17915 [Knoellia sinensis KCTC 19936]
MDIDEGVVDGAGSTTRGSSMAELWAARAASLL